MIVQKVFGITQISPGTSFEFRIVQLLMYIGVIGWTILWILCGFLWPLYYFYCLYRYIKYGEKMGGDDESYYPWGVKYGVLWNTLIFIGIYVIMPIKLVADCAKEQAEAERIQNKKIEYFDDYYDKYHNDYENGVIIIDEVSKSM